MTDLCSRGTRERLHWTAVAPLELVGVDGSSGQPWLGGAQGEGERLAGHARRGTGNAGRWRDRHHGDTGFHSRDAGSGSVGGGNRLDAGRHQGRCESVRATVGAGERVIGGEDCLAVATRESDGSHICDRRVAIGIKGGDREITGGARNDRKRKTRDHELGSRRRVHQDSRLTAGNAGGRRILDREGLAAGGLQGCSKYMSSGVGAGEAVIRR